MGWLLRWLRLPVAGCEIILLLLNLLMASFSYCRRVIENGVLALVDVDFTSSDADRGTNKVAVAWDTSVVKDERLCI